MGGGGGVFASFLPGIVIALTKLVTMDTAKVGKVKVLESKHDVSSIHTYSLLCLPHLDATRL